MEWGPKVHLSEKQILDSATSQFIDAVSIAQKDSDSYSVKVDVGLSLDAPHSISWLREEPSLVVFGFEPLERCLKSIEEHFLALPDGKDLRKRFVLVPAALGDSCNELIFYECANPGVSSVKRPVRFEVQREISVYQFTLDHFLLELQALSGKLVTRIDHIKTDCQGGDYRVLRGAVKTLQNCVAVTCETDSMDYFDSNENSVQSLRRFFSGIGFTHINRRGPIREILGPILQRSPIHNQVKKVIGALDRLSFNFSKQSKEDQRPSTYVSDPTFVNAQYAELVENGTVRLSQFA